MNTQAHAQTCFLDMSHADGRDLAAGTPARRARGLAASEHRATASATKGLPAAILNHQLPTKMRLLLALIDRDHVSF
jgi:hypothetical protein